MRGRLTRVSRFLSLVLRHRPDQIDLELDEAGWASIEQLVERASSVGKELNRELILEVVRTNDKQRFAISPDGLRIRARQGHSIPVDLELRPVEPPELLFHGTADRFVESIRDKGLLAGSRLHVHLSKDRETATKVGRRHGRPVVLLVEAGKMWAAGYIFYLSENGVWLTAKVPAAFIRFSEGCGQRAD